MYKQKAATYDMDQVVSCEVVGRCKDNLIGASLKHLFKSFVLDRGEDKLTVRLVHLAESGWRWVEFEGCRNTVEAVVDKASSVTLLSLLIWLCQFLM